MLFNQRAVLFWCFVAICSSGAGEALNSLWRGAGQSQPQYLHLLPHVPASGLGMAESACVTSPERAALSTKFTSLSLH